MRISPAMIALPRARYRLAQWCVALFSLALCLGLGLAAREMGLGAERSGLLLTLDGVEARLALISSSMAETVFLSRHGVDPKSQPITRRGLERLYRPIISRLHFIDSVLVTRGPEVLLYLKKDGERVEALPPERAPFAAALAERLAVRPAPAAPEAQAEPGETGRDDAPQVEPPVAVPSGFGPVHRDDGDLIWSRDPSGAGGKRVFASLRLPDDDGRPVTASFGVDLSGLDDPQRASSGEEAGVILFGYGDSMVGAVGRQGFLAPRDGALEGPAGAAAAAFAAAGRNYLEVVDFTWQGKPWRGVFDKLTLIDRTSFIGYAAPKGKAKAGLGWGAGLLWGLSGLSLAMGAGVMLLLAALRRRMRAGLLSAGMDGRLSAQDVLALIRAGEHGELEFKSTLRTNLYSGKADKRIELACIKTIAAFLNSQGGVLLVGVEDTGDVLGTEADGFPGTDRLLLHFVNLFNQHIGAEHARFVSAQAVAVEERVVLAITCRRADTPVIVKSGDDEHYYVRVGPATNELTLSQVVALLRK